MPATLVVKSSIKSATADPSRAEIGQITRVVSDTSEFGFNEMPVNFQGVANIATTNALSPAEFQAWRMTEAGTVTVGSKNVEVAVDDVLIYMRLGYFVNFGPRTDFTIHNYHVWVTNRTAEQLKDYQKEWRHDPTTAIDINDGVGGYRITISTNAVSITGKNAVTRAQMDSFIERWNGLYVSHTNTSYTFDITAYAAATSEGFWNADLSGTVFEDEGFSAGVQQVRIVSTNFSTQQIQNAILLNDGAVSDSDSFTIDQGVLYNKFKQDIEDKWQEITHRKRRFWINSAGMALLINPLNNGILSGSATQLSNLYLTDGLET